MKTVELINVEEVDRTLVGLFKQGKGFIIGTRISGQLGNQIGIYE